MKRTFGEDGVTETYTGRAVNASDLRPEDICLDDIAHQLGMECRFVGACSQFYSVAEHAVAVARFVEQHLDGTPEESFTALHHDDFEAYAKDIPSPQKTYAYRAAEDRGMRVIAPVLGFVWPKPPKVCVADDAVKWLETDALMRSCGVGWPGYEPHGRERIEADGGRYRRQLAGRWLHPQGATRLFMAEHRRLAALA